MVSFKFLLWVWIAIGIISFMYLLFKPAPYGRHVAKGWGPTLNNQLAWFLMEVPVFIIVLIYGLMHYEHLSLVSLILIAMFLLHYFNRCFIYPLRLKKTKDRMPLTIVLSAFSFNLVNGNVLGYYLTGDTEIVINGVFIFGVFLFFIGMLINIYADEKLRRLRAQSQGYEMPSGGIYNYVSCPNYLGEIIEWFGFAMAGGGLATWSFFIWTCANLVPRALSNHRWYNAKFSDYPSNRKALIPFLL